MKSKIREWGLPTAMRLAANGVSGGARPDETYAFGERERVVVREPPFPDRENHAGEYPVPRNDVSVFERARLLGPEDPVGLSRDGSPIEHVARNLDFDVVRQLRGAGELLGWSTLAGELVGPRRFRRGPDATYDCVVPFTRRSPEMGYYHWITEYLPRLRGVAVYREATGCDPPILLDPDPPSWVTESLALAGVPVDGWIEWTPGTATVERLVVPRYNRKGFPTPFEPSRADLVWIRDRLRASVREGAGTGADRVFVSREDADERRLENRAAVVDVAREYGFEVIVPTELSVEEQIGTFRSADVVLGPHGAGMTNVLFADDTTLVELFPNDYTPIYYHMLCGMFGFDHEWLLGDDATPDFEVSPEALDRLLAESIA